MVKRSTMAGLTLMAVVSVALTVRPATAQEAKLEMSLKDHKFEPAEIKAAANKPIVVRVKNMMAENMEFESEALKVEVVVKANAEGLVKIKPQKPGRYTFFDDFHQETTGTLVIE
jgi:plastocyanin